MIQWPTTELSQVIQFNLSQKWFSRLFLTQIRLLRHHHHAWKIASFLLHVMIRRQNSTKTSSIRYHHVNSTLAVLAVGRSQIRPDPIPALSIRQTDLGLGELIPAPNST